MKTKKDMQPPPIEDRHRSEATRELFEVTDDELPLKTETPQILIMPFAIMETMEAATNLNRTEKLSKIFRRAFDKRMISRARKGRGEAIQILSQKSSADEEDLLGI